MVIRFLAGCLVFLVFFSTAQPTVSKRHFKVKEATRRSWSPGTVRDNTSPAGGYLFELNVKVRKKGTYEIQKLIVDGEALVVETTQAGDTKLTNSMRRCSNWVFISRSNINNKQPIDDAVAQVIRKESGVAAWLLYKFKGARFLTPVPEIQTTKQGSPNQ